MRKLPPSPWACITPLVLLAIWTAVWILLSMPGAAETAARAAATQPQTPINDPKAQVAAAQAQGSLAHNKLLIETGWPATALLLISFILGMTESMSELQRRITLAFWTIAPAVYLFLEYRIFWDRLAPDHLEALRHFQDLTRNVWLGCIAVLAAIYKIKFGET